MAAFHFDQERALWKLHEELTSKTYRPGAYRRFFIHEPKERQISAAPYRDRVVHHALTGVREPIFEWTFISESYACRRGKGTHAAARRCQEFARRFRYMLKADIQKFLPTRSGRANQSILASFTACCKVTDQFEHFKDRGLAGSVATHEQLRRSRSELEVHQTFVVVAIESG